MLTYFIRGISVMLAVLYSVASVCLRSVPTEEIPADTAMLPKESIIKDDENIVVQILHNHDDIRFELQQAIDLYTSKSIYNTNFSVQTITLESDYYSALRASLLSNDGAVLFQIGGARECIELESFIRPLESDEWINSAYDGSIDAVSMNGHIYGIPYSIEAVGLICSQDAFDAAEIIPENIRSLEDLDEAFAKIKEKIVSGESEALIDMENVTQFAVGDKAFLSEKLADIVLSGAFSSAQEPALSKSVSFPASEQAEEFVKIMAKYSGSHPNWSALTEITDAQQIENLANGRVAAILHDTGVYKRINSINPDMRGRLLLVPIPLDIFEQPSVYTGVSSYWAINSSASDKEADAALRFLEWLYTSDEGCELFANYFGEISAFRNTAKSTGVSLHSQMLRFMSADMTMPRFYREFPFGWGKNIFAAHIQSYFTEREKTWMAVIEDCKNGWSGN